MSNMDDMLKYNDISSDDDLREIAGAGKELPFRVPRHYFEDFSARIMTAVETEEMPAREKKLKLTTYLKPVLGLAASFIAIFMIVYVPAKLITPTTPLAANEITNGENRVLHLVEHVDDHTFFSLLEDESENDSPDEEMLESYLATNFTDFDLFMHMNP